MATYIPVPVALNDEGTPDEVAIQNMIYTRMQVDRCLKYAFEYTRKRNRKNTLALSTVKAMYPFMFSTSGKELFMKWEMQNIPI